MISKEEVLKIAKLARLELTETEVEKMQHDMSAILDYVNILQNTKINPSTKLRTRMKNDPPAPRLRRAGNAKSKITENILRKDEVEVRPASLANNLIAMAPDTKEGYIKVKTVF